MTQLKKQISPLRQRMIDEMNMVKLSPKTQQTYWRAVERLAKYLKHSPEQATSEQLRQFQIELVAQGASSATINATITGIQFLYWRRQRMLALESVFQCTPCVTHLPPICWKLVWTSELSKHC